MTQFKTLEHQIIKAGLPLESEESLVNCTCNFLLYGYMKTVVDRDLWQQFISQTDVHTVAIGLVPKLWARAYGNSLHTSKSNAYFQSIKFKSTALDQMELWTTSTKYKMGPGGGYSYEHLILWLTHKNHGWNVYLSGPLISLRMDFFVWHPTLCRFWIPNCLCFLCLILFDFELNTALMCIFYNWGHPRQIFFL